MPDDSQTFLTVTEAAKELRVSVPTLYGWVHRRLIKYRKHGRKLVFKRSDLQEWSNSKVFEPLTFKKPELKLVSTKCSKSICSLKTEYTADEPTSKGGN